MQEYVLFGQVASENHRQVMQQCVGVSRMQPEAVEELHLIFKPKPPQGLAEIQKSSGGGSQGVVPPEVQKTRTMLNASLYYVQVVGTAQAETHSSGREDAKRHVHQSGDLLMSDGDVQQDRTRKQLKWTLEFRDIPDPGKQPVTSRLLYKIPILEGDVMKYIQDFGFQYTSRYVVKGYKVYDQDTTLFLHTIMQVSEDDAKTTSTDIAIMPESEKLTSLNNSDGYILSATIESTDGTNSELRERAMRQLLVMKETMKGAVSLTPGDRLAMDTKVPFAAGQRR